MESKQQVEFVAKSAALQVVFSLREAVGDMVADAVAVHAKVPKEEQRPVRRFERLFKPEPKPVSNYGNIISDRIKWQTGKGEQLAVAWLFKPESSLKLMVEEYGADNPECAILQLDRAQPKSRFENGDLIAAGKSPWVDFKVVKGTSDYVIGRLKEKGWFVQSSCVNAPVQMTLPRPDGGGAL